VNTRNPHITSTSSSLELLHKLYEVEKNLLGRLDPIELARTGSAHKELMRIRRLVKSHLMQQGVRVDDDDQRGRPE
jgi:hypothetical protein